MKAYKNYITEFKRLLAQNVKNIYIYQLAEELSVAPEQIYKDFAGLMPRQTDSIAIARMLGRINERINHPQIMQRFIFQFGGYQFKIAVRKSLN
jgi:NADH/NAD ratio-sensing transcriptional regulator Rex